MNLNEMIQQDIQKCEEMINKNFATREDLDGLIAKYKTFNSNFGSTIIYYAESPGHKPNYAPKIKIIKSELEGLLVKVNMKEFNNNSTTPQVINEINLTQNQTNNNSNNNYFELDELVKNVKKYVNDISDNSLKLEIIDNIDGLQEELKKDNPRKGIIKSITDSLKLALPKIKSAIELTAAITQIIAFATMK